MRDRRAWVATLVALLAALAILVALPAAALASSGRNMSVDAITIADAPPGDGEDCVDDPNLHPGTGLRACPKPFDVLSLAPFVGGGFLVLLAIVVGWFLVMRRRTSRPFLPDEALGIGGAGSGGASVPAGAAPAAAAGWWTCRNCGSTNMTDSARCYRCGSWPR